jgi:hypothetical protein
MGTMSSGLIGKSVECRGAGRGAGGMTDIDRGYCLTPTALAALAGRGARPIARGFRVQVEGRSAA